MPRSPWWGRKVARLPDHGTLIVATDLQGNFEDYEALKDVYAREADAGNDPTLLLCGDLVHGPGEMFADPARWPDYLGAFYRDRSAELVFDYQQWSADTKTVALLGNHEHSHIGGPVVSKFHGDEAAVLDQTLGSDAPRVHDFFRTFSLIAVAPCGAVFTHGAPRATEPSLEDFERLRYDGFERMAVNDMYEQGTLGALLWARYAEPEHARALLEVAHEKTDAAGFVAFGHDVVRSGYEKVGDEQICVSTSFGCDDRNKRYLRLDLSRSYGSVHDLHDDVEILPLYPNA
ncbi:MAG: metallophosphoesterase [Deltaproteobacteria bacterium]|nr:metallophosphoesterase [Deltaproteobacteria bacterium]